jgi:hypothetical protein
VSGAPVRQGSWQAPPPPVEDDDAAVVVAALVVAPEVAAEVDAAEDCAEVEEAEDVTADVLVVVPAPLVAACVEVPWVVDVPPAPPSPSVSPCAQPTSATRTGVVASAPSRRANPGNCMAALLGPRASPHDRQTGRRRKESGPARARRLW